MAATLPEKVDAPQRAALIAALQVAGTVVSGIALRQPA